MYQNIMLTVSMDCIYNYSINTLRHRRLVKAHFFIAIVFYIVLPLAVFDTFIAAAGEFLHNH